MQRFRKPQLVFVALLALAGLTCNLTQPGGTPPQAEETAPTAGQELESIDVTVEEIGRITKTVNAITGGEIALSTPDGDVVQLFIPPFALPENTEISLAALSKPLDSPFRENFFPGLAIEPDNLPLRLPATLTITLPNHKIASGERIFYLKSPELAIPLWQSQVAGSSLIGKISHFSGYIGGSPGAEEARTQAAAASRPGGDFPGGWKDSLEGNQSISEWGNALSELGLSEDASQVINQARERLQEELECLMDLNCSTPPLDPCGDYQQMLMQYYQQAVLLAFDPESPMMQFLYDELQRVLNECTNRYALEYAHKLKVNQGEFEQEISVTGRVIFNAPIYGVFESGEPLKMEGSGPVKVSISGQMIVGDEVCTLEGSGSNEVALTGQLEADEMGYPWIALDVSETWYTSGSMTFTCPNGASQTVPLPSMANQQFPLRFQYEDGAKSMAPNLGGMQGDYIWILHILHTW